MINIQGNKKNVLRPWWHLPLFGGVLFYIVGYMDDVVEGVGFLHGLFPLTIALSVLFGGLLSFCVEFSFRKLPIHAALACYTILSVIVPLMLSGGHMTTFVRGFVMLGVWSAVYIRGRQRLMPNALKR